MTGWTTATIVILAIASMVGVGACRSDDPPLPRQQIGKIAEDAFLYGYYGYPLGLMDETERLGGASVSQETSTFSRVECRAVSPAATPPGRVDEMTGVAFLQALAHLMAKTPAPARDEPLLADLARIGFVPGETFRPALAVGDQLDAAKSRAKARMLSTAGRAGSAVNGWRVILKGIGEYGTDYETRAAVAAFGLGANLPEDAVYSTTFVDSDGKALTGARRYVVHFPPGGLPPVKAFWSLTLYDASSYLVANPIGRYTIHDYDPIARNPDGSLDLYIQSRSPGGSLESNWLPSPVDASFSLPLRLYWPLPEVFDGGFQPPAVKAVSVAR